MKPYFDTFGNFIGTIPRDCVTDCAAKGDVTEAVQFWVKKLRFSVPRDKAMPYIRAFGAYTAEELADMSDFRIDCFCLWQACCDIKEEGDYYGLFH